MNQKICRVTNKSLLKLCFIGTIEHLLSQEKPASMSSIYVHNGPFHAFNGNLLQSCLVDGCAHSKGGKVNWLQVDLIHQSVINRVKIYNRMDCCSERLQNAEIHISDDEFMSINLQLCSSFFNITTTNQIENFNCRVPMVGRYVRLTQQHDPFALSICEMQIFGYFNLP